MELKQQFITVPKKPSEQDHAQRVVEMVMGVRVNDNNRKRQIVEARMMFSSMLRDMGYSLKEIGTVLKKDHTTIIHYLRKLKELTEVDRSLFKKYIKCRELLMLNEEPVNLAEELERLHKKVEILKMENYILSEEKNELIKQLTSDDKRLQKIFKLIEENTQHGYEGIVERKIRKMFDD